MRQWVNIEPIGIVTPPNFKDVPEVTLQFEVRNKTDYLVTIKKTVAEVFTGGKARLFTVVLQFRQKRAVRTADTRFICRLSWAEALEALLPCPSLSEEK
jgi:hypothetical protein